MDINAFGAVEYREFSYNTHTEHINPAPRAGSVISYPISDLGNVRVEKSNEKCDSSIGARPISTGNVGAIEINLDSANYDSTLRRYTGTGQTIHTDGSRSFYYSSSGKKVYVTANSGFAAHELITDRSIVCTLRDLSDIGLWYSRKVGKFELDTFGSGLLSTIFGDSYVKTDTRRRVTVYSQKPMRLSAFKQRISSISDRCRDNGVTVSYEMLEDFVPADPSVEIRVASVVSRHPELLVDSCVMTDPSIREVLGALYDDDDHYDIRDILSYERYIAGPSELNSDPTFNLNGTGIVKSIDSASKESVREVSRMKVSRDEYDKYYSKAHTRLAKYAMLVDYGWSKRKVKYTKNCKTRYKMVKEYIGHRVVVVSFATNGAVSNQAEIDAVDAMSSSTVVRESSSRAGRYPVCSLDYNLMKLTDDLESALFVDGAASYYSSGGTELDGISPGVRKYANAFISILRSEFNRVDVVNSGKSLDQVSDELGADSLGLSWFQYGYALRAVIGNSSGDIIADNSDDFWKLYGIVKDFAAAMRGSGYEFVWGAQLNQKPDRFTFEFIPDGKRDVLSLRERVIATPSPSPSEFIQKYHVCLNGFGSDCSEVPYDYEFSDMNSAMEQSSDGDVIKVGDDVFSIVGGVPVAIIDRIHWYRSNPRAVEMMRIYAQFVGDSKILRNLFCVEVAANLSHLLHIKSNAEFIQKVAGVLPGAIIGFEIDSGDDRSIIIDYDARLYLANAIGVTDNSPRFPVSVNFKSVTGSKYIRVLGYSPLGTSMVKYMRIGDVIGNYSIISIRGNIVELSQPYQYTGFSVETLTPNEDSTSASPSEFVRLDGITWPLSECKSELLELYDNAQDAAESSKVYSAFRASISEWISECVGVASDMPVLYTRLSDSSLADDIESLTNEFGPIHTQKVIDLDTLKSLYELTKTRVKISNAETVVDGDYRNLGTAVYEETISTLVSANITRNGFDRMVMDDAMVDEFSRNASMYSQGAIGDASLL